ncbi:MULTISPECIES: SDR family NAD(P)-dependent oxidoreductase [Mycobacteriaceae]|uniref:Short-chain dehydrogenase n=1 Tax=Mycolicibacterium neoaurum VKM Ac-1815D TaxID=700508 RepID=V5XDV0_MYCNE|nr:MULTISPECIES: SDR family NAD(P)-dependent oxidoreductase [Mycobacteriaceae]AXK75372.1 SDR family NAD(P)-dependent oxidoreductase [Mycolicibacterium neoaurum]KUM08261.1 hypothetical protein AVZ31_11605 [Mycolicibacterium neoaurum]
MNRLAGKIALVTGAAQGIGRSVAEQFAAQGATVYATDLTTGQPPSGSQAMTLDVTDPDQWAQVVDTITRQSGTIDILVNNAGVIAYADIATVTDAEWERVLAVDQTGVMLGMRAVIPGMKQRGGSIINLSSAWGVVGGSGVAAYQAAKGAVRSVSNRRCSRWPSATSTPSPPGISPGRTLPMRLPPITVRRTYMRQRCR